MRLLEIIGTYLGAWNVRRDCENRHGASLAIVQSIDEMKVAGTATPGADGEIAGDVSVGARGEGGNFLMADVDPLNDFLPAHRVGDPVERIADYSVDSLNPSRGERGYEALCYCRHDLFPP